MRHKVQMLLQRSPAQTTNCVKIHRSSFADDTHTSSSNIYAEDDLDLWTACANARETF